MSQSRRERGKLAFFLTKYLKIEKNVEISQHCNTVGTHTTLPCERVTVGGVAVTVTGHTLAPVEGAVQPPVAKVAQLAREARVARRTLALLHRGGPLGADGAF